MRIWIGAIGTKGRMALAPRTLNMLPKFELAPIRTYLRMFAEDLAALDHAVLDDQQALFEQDDVGRLLGDVHRRVHRDADVGGAERGRVVDAVAEEPDDVLARLQHLDDALLVRRRHPGEQRRALGGRRPAPHRTCFSTWLPSRTASVAMPTSWQILRLTRSLSPVRIFTATPCCASAASAAGAVSFGGSRKAT